MVRTKTGPNGAKIADFEESVAARASEEIAAALEALASGGRPTLTTGVTSPRIVRAFDLLAQQLQTNASAPTTSLLAPNKRGRSKMPTYVALMGAGGFSTLRGHIGSKIADQVLRATADRIRNNIGSARIGRIGRTNIEFAFTAPNDASAMSKLHALQDVLGSRLEIEGQSFDLEISLGYASLDECGDSTVECAALALGHAQVGHKKVVGFSEEDRSKAAARLVMLGDLRRAITADELFVVYQPKLHTRTNEIHSVEALIRWQHPERGLIPPDEFIGPAEETGLVADLTRWVLVRAIEDQALLVERGHHVEIYVNLSGRLVADKGFIDWAIETVAARAEGQIGFEITETAVIDDPETALAHLHALADAGIKIAIDDYGSGLSSLAYLKQLPAHELKIDQMFISGLTSSHRDPLLVRSTIDLAHALEMVVTAEGVSNPGSLALLRMMGCDHVQGYLISKPLEFADLDKFLSADVELASQIPAILMEKLRASKA
jgi:diguanylate cyclase